MTRQLTSVPQMLDDTRNVSEVARVLKVSRNTVQKYREDHGCKYHIIVDGVLMVETMAKKLIARAA